MRLTLIATLTLVALSLTACAKTNVWVTAPCPAPADTVIVEPAPTDTTKCNHWPCKDKKHKHGKKHSGEPDVGQIDLSKLDAPIMLAGVTPGPDPGDDMPSFSPWFGVGGWKAVRLATEALIADLFN